MQIPSHKKRRIIIILESNGKFLVHKKSGKWSFPDTYLDWPIDKPRIRPLHMGSWMVLNLFNGLIDEYKIMKKKFTNFKKYISPSNYMIYHIQYDLENALHSYNLQRKFYGKQIPKLELHDPMEIKNFEPGKYLGSSIEAFGCLHTI